MCSVSRGSSESWLNALCFLSLILCMNPCSSPCRCEGCAFRLKSALEAAPGIRSAAVDFASGRVGVEVAAGSALNTPEALKHAIRAVDLTYQVQEASGNNHHDVQEGG